MKLVSAAVTEPAIQSHHMEWKLEPTRDQLSITRKLFVKSKYTWPSVCLALDGDGKFDRSLTPKDDPRKEHTDGLLISLNEKTDPILAFESY